MKKYILTALIPFLIYSCEDSVSSDESFEYEEITTTAMEPGTVRLLGLSSTNGLIDILGSDTASFVNIEITRRVKSYRSSLRAIDHINDIKVTFESGPEGLNITTDHPDLEDLDYEIDFRIIAPIIFDYKLLLGNGEVSINSVSRNLDVTLGNGNTLADVILMNNCNARFEGGNGNIHLIIPDITNAHVSATVGNGTISESGLQMTDKVVTGNTLMGTMGDGEGSLQILLGNGNILLEGY